VSFLSKLSKEKRRDYPAVERNVNLGSLTVGIYSSKSHFIYELLQNAEDAGSKTAEFDLSESRLNFSNDGHQFTERNIKRICTFGYSDKEEDTNMIGKFGMGFKSVYAITKTPEIHSGDYHFSIKKFIIPEEISSFVKENGSRFVLRFNQENTPKQKAYELIKGELESFDPMVLLFLTNLNRIKWKTPHSTGEVRKEEKKFKKYDDISIVSLFLSIGEDVREIKFLILSKEKPRGTEGSKMDYIKIAFRMNEHFDTVISSDVTNLFAFFPTKVHTGLSFLIQAPFELTKNREEVQEDDEKNQTLWKILHNLFKESLSVLKKEGLVNLEFLQLLPINSVLSENNHIYDDFSESLAKKLLQEPLIPTQRGYALPDEVLISRTAGLENLFISRDIEKMFDRNKWVHKNIRKQSFAELRTFLREKVEVESVSIEDVAREISVKILKTKEDSWFRRFYTFLIDHENQWQKGKKGAELRQQPIILTSKNQLVEPFDENDIPQVYLPGESSTYFKTVKKAILESEEALRFLNKLGLRSPDQLAEIEKYILPRYEKASVAITDIKYEPDIRKIVSFYNGASEKKRDDFTKQVGRIPFLKAENCLGRIKFLKPSEAYIDIPDLREYFEGYNGAFFIDIKFVKGISEKQLSKMLIDWGVRDLPEIIEFCRDYGEFGSKKLNELRGKTGSTRNESLIDKHMEGLENCLANNFDYKKSVVLWKFLLKHTEQCDGRYDVEKMFEGLYEWYFYSTNYKNFTSMYLEMLINTAWLFDQEGNRKRPKDIFPSELADIYERKFLHADVLFPKLGFKDEIRKSLSSEEQKKLELTDDIHPDILQDIIMNYKKGNEQNLENEELSEADEDNWEPEIPADEANLTFEEIKNHINKTEPPDDKGHYSLRAPKDNSRNKSKILIKRGNYGEECVYNYLLKKYKKKGKIEENDNFFQCIYGSKVIKVIWENKFTEKGKPYDLFIKEDGQAFEYIEVKTKSSQALQWVDVSEDQWELARTLYECEEGDKYCFYVVIDPGDKDSMIGVKHTNPIKKWKEGKLIAAALRFKL